MTMTLTKSTSSFFFLAVLLVLAVSVLFPAQILTSMPLLPILMMLEKVLKQK